MRKIVKFEKEDCNPCKMVSEFFNSRNVSYESVNAFNVPEMAMKYRVRSVPTTILFDGDSELMRVVGYQPVELSSLIESV